MTEFEQLSKKLSNLCTKILSTSQLPSSSSSSPSSSPSTTLPILPLRSDFIILSTQLGKESTSLTLGSKVPISIKAMEGTLSNMEGILGKIKFLLEGCDKEGGLGREIRYVWGLLSFSFKRLL